jgi:hypothetical protein
MRPTNTKAAQRGIAGRLMLKERSGPDGPTQIQLIRFSSEGTS